MLGLIAFLLAIGITTAEADDAAQVAAHWQALTRIDVNAAWALLKNNHPAALPEVGDKQFTNALAAGHKRALDRAKHVDNYQGYVAALGEFAASMGDGHIWSHPLFLPRTVEWAGLVVARRGNAWVIARDDPKIAGAELTGARLLGCDGEDTDALARDRLHFIANVSMEFARVIYGGWLLVDRGSPFLPPLRQCTFELNGKRTTLTLNRDKIDYYEYFTNYMKDRFGQAGFGLRPSHGGFWISIQELDPKAQPVIDAVKAQAEKIRYAPYVVVDVRGNSGGSDAYGRALAEALYGTDYVASILGPRYGEKGSCPEAFRASSGNIEALSNEAQKFHKSGNTYAARDYLDALEAMKAAHAVGRALTAGLVCPKRAPQPSAGAVSLMRGKVFVLTDALCFSSCIGTVEYFRRLGAIQVGQATGADTHYTEVREVVLPSGLSTFSTLQALDPDAPHNIGPFEPEHDYDGDIADTTALETWIADKLAK
jgi:Peptidase family S41